MDNHDKTTQESEDAFAFWKEMKETAEKKLDELSKQINQDKSK